MPKITAAEARTIAFPGIEDRLNEAYERIREAAIAKKRKIHLHGNFWANEGYDSTDNYKAVVASLREDGFIVDFFYEERQFVNMFTVVKW